jgi:V/A-type H+-transporting ATPase subunit D
MIAPNKQNLLKLKNQIKTFRSGFKLLTEKRNGLIKLFLDMAREGKELELQLSNELNGVMQAYSQAITYVSSQDLETEIPFQPVTSLHTRKKRISGVYIENLDLDVKSPDRPTLRDNIQQPMNKFAHYFPLLLKVSQLRINCQRISEEIIKTNRQIANVEKKIEQTQSQIKYIKELLSDQENMNKATLKRIFN